MNWLRRLLHGAPTPPHAEPLPSPALKEEQAKHRRLIKRADNAVHDVMEHADEMFAQPYKGPDRRTQHR